tara:strand:- start:1143 stop:1352 length:210 start_codon:yes stop_codon:yes gene_type:complete
MDTNFEVVFIILDKIMDVIDYFETKLKKKEKHIEIEMENKTKYEQKENYIEKDFTLIKYYSKICKKDCM